MTRQEALQEARLRWGAMAEIEHRPERIIKSGRRAGQVLIEKFSVGYQDNMGGMMTCFMVDGESDHSWEGAFKEADKEGKRLTEHYEGKSDKLRKSLHAFKYRNEAGELVQAYA